MKTNLIFKRQVTIDGVTKVVTRIVSVDIPSINAGEGWMLHGHTDSLEICDGVYANPVNTADVESVPVKMNSENITKPEEELVDPTTEKDNLTKFQSDVSGTAKLVRSRGVIKIVARRGKTTYNQTTSNSICISDDVKNTFFKSCRDAYGPQTSNFTFSFNDQYYNFWNSFIDKEFEKQKQNYINKQKENSYEN